jgi:hypothetical protein
MGDFSATGFLPVVREFLVSARFCALIAISITLVVFEPPLISDLVSLQGASDAVRLVIGCLYVLSLVGLVLHASAAVAAHRRRAKRAKQLCDQVWTLSAKELVVLSDAALRGEMAVMLPLGGMVARSLTERGYLRLRNGVGSPLRYAFAVNKEAAPAMAILRASMEDEGSDIHATHLKSLRRDYHEYLHAPVFGADRW